MSWIKWVARPDVPLKDALTTWAIGNTAEETNLWGYPELANLPKVHIMYLGPLVHLHRERNAPVFMALVNIFDNKNSKCYFELSDKYHKLADELFAFLEQVFNSDLKKYTNEELIASFDKFVELYLAYGPVINSGAAGDWLYRTKYDGFMKEMSGRLLTRAQQHIDSLPLEVRFILKDCLGPDDEVKARASKLLREGLTFSERRTYGERKEDALWNVAAAIEESPKALDALRKGGVQELERANQDLFKMLVETHQKWSWTQQWSLPPTYSPATLEDYVGDILRKISEGAKSHIESSKRQRETDRMRYEDLKKALNLSDKERDFIDTVNLFTYFRTWRMEVSSRATYLVTPLLLEMGKRLPSLKEPVDIVYLAPWEIDEIWQNCDVPASLLGLLNERKNGYAVYMHNGRPEFYSGKALVTFREGLLAVINCRETGRGQYTTEETYVGGKARNLFKLMQLNQNVPPFFVVTIEAFRTFIEHNKLDKRLNQLLNNDPSEEQYREIQNLIMQAEIPEHILAAIDEQVKLFGFQSMAVRSSAAPEDAAGISWAGRFISLIGIEPKDLIRAVKQVWASLLNPIALRYAAGHKVDLLKSGMAVIVQQVVVPDVAGVINTTKSLKDPNIAEVEAALGLGEAVVSGAITPDTYYVDKRDLSIVNKSVAEQHRKLDISGWTDITNGSEQKLSDEEIKLVVKTAAGIERALENPQDIEFVVQQGKVFIVQTRPQTGLESSLGAENVQEAAPETAKAQLLVTGLKGKVETVFKGTARVIMSPSEGKRFETGEILVAPLATPVWDPILYRAAAIVTDEGGATSHAIRVANEQRIPVIVGTGEATKRILDGELIALDTTSSDSFRGKVYRIKE
jgi:phosphohistidine swiveling domain-containing protein